MSQENNKLTKQTDTYEWGTIPLGSRINGDIQEDLYVEEQVFATHMAIYGGTGQGKSKFLENTLRFLILNRRGLCLIDPHGDLAEDVLGFIKENQERLSPHLRRHLYYLEPSHPTHSFSFDPFRYHSEDGDYDTWLNQKVHWAAKAIIRMQGEPDFQGMNRLERWMKNVLTAVAVQIDDKGTHLPLADALFLLDPLNTRWDDVFERIAPFLPPEVRANFEALRRPNNRKAREEIESTENRLRSFLTPRVKAIFSQQAEPLDLRLIVKKGGLLIINLKGLLPEEANAIGGVIINDLFATVSQISRLDRRRFYLFIDEATRFVGDDLVKGFGEARKWLLSICLAVQDLSSLRNNRIDMTPRVNSQCGVKISFQQQNPEDLEMLGKMYAYKDLDRTRKIVEVDRFSGHKLVVLKGTNQESSTGTRADESDGTSTLFRDFESQRVNRGTARGRTQSDGHGQSTRETLVPEYRTEERDEGLQYAIDEQVAYRMADLAELGHREALVAVGKEKPFTIYTPNVSETLSSFRVETRAKMIDKFKLELFNQQDCFFEYHAAGNQESRLDKFLGYVEPTEPVVSESNTSNGNRLRQKDTSVDDSPSPWGL